MTRKDYELLAEVIRTSRKVTTGETALVSVEHLANTLATELEIENPRFDRARFLSACGLED